MTWGIKVTGRGGNLCISSEDTNYDYIGAPTLVSTFDPATITGQQYEEKYSGETRIISSGEAGVDKIWVTDNQDWHSYPACRNPTFLIWSAGYSDDIRILTYTIYAQKKPLVFIYSVYGYNAVLIGTTATGNTDPITGYPEWSIKLAGRAALGSGGSIASSLSIYCFDLITDTGETWGVKLFTANGDLAFMNTEHPLVVKDILEITALTTSLNMTSDTLVGDLSDLDLLSKPAFLAVDFAHFDHVGSSDEYKRVGRFYLTGPGTADCDNYRRYWPKFTSSGIAGGLHWHSSTQTVDLALITLKTTGLDAVYPTKPTEGVSAIYSALPAYIPVIDGANYD